MSKTTTLTLKIVNDENILDSLPKANPLSEEHKQLIKLIARIAVDEYIQEMRASPQPLQHDRILRLREVMQIVGLSRSSIYMHINQNTFPEPIKLSRRSVGWRESDIINWLNAR